jgi:hypothetical protein
MENRMKAEHRRTDALYIKRLSSQGLFVLGPDGHGRGEVLVEDHMNNDGLAAHLAILHVLLIFHGRVDADVQRLPTVGALNQYRVQG